MKDKTIIMDKLDGMFLKENIIYTGSEKPDLEMIEIRLPMVTDGQLLELFKICKDHNMFFFVYAFSDKIDIEMRKRLIK